MKLRDDGVAESVYKWLGSVGLHSGLNAAPLTRRIFSVFVDFPHALDAFYTAFSYFYHSVGDSEMAYSALKLVVGTTSQSWDQQVNNVTLQFKDI